jgi:hypothetical protein
MCCGAGRVALEEDEGGLSVALDAADFLAAELGWGAAQRRRELDAYRALVVAARRAWLVSDYTNAKVKPTWSGAWPMEIPPWLWFSD